MRCHAEHRTIRAADDNRLVRKQREAAAPGLGYAAQKRLLSKWKRQGKRCTYCEALADTIDHAVPLVRGGTNHEGNLVPACRACNSSKAGWTIAEWRTGKRLPRMAQPIPWKRATAKPTKPEPVPLSAVCQLCGTAFTPRRTGTKYCGTDCAVRANANSARFRYHAMRRAARIHHTDPAMRQGKVRTSAA